MRRDDRDSAARSISGDRRKEGNENFGVLRDQVQGQLFIACLELGRVLTVPQDP